MTVNDVLALLAVTTALRVFLPDLRAGTRRLLRTAARVGVAELLQTRSTSPAGTHRAASADSRDAEA